VGLISDPVELPPRIRVHLEDADVLADGLIAAVKTAHKPNATIPILWMVIHKSGITFCCTHRTRGIFKQFHKSEVNSVRVAQASGLGPPMIELISTHLDEEDFSVPLPPGSDLSSLRDVLISERYQVL